MSVRATFCYPGDPAVPVEFMFGREFDERHPNRVIRIGALDTPGPDDTVIPVPEVICDLCNAEVTAFQPCAVTESRLYCWACATEWVLPHVRTEA